MIEIYLPKLITIDKICGGIEAVYDTACPHILYFGPGPSDMKYTQYYHKHITDII